jgi:hypothetical protein
MSIDEVKLEDVATEEQIQEETEELVENLDEAEVELEEAKKVKEEDESDEEEVEEEDEDEEEVKVEAVQVPKTKAGVIQAAVEMLKKARKEDAQALFAKMSRVDETKDEDEEEKAESKAKVKVESVDFDEDLDALVQEEATLSEDFRGKAGAIFEAVLTSKLAKEVERLEGEYVQNLEEEVSEIQTSLVEKVDSYMNYVVETWMQDNEVAVETGLRTEIAEEFMASLQSVFVEHYIDVPEGKVDLVDDLSEQVAELEETLNKSTEDNIQLHQSVQDFQRAEIVREHSSELATTEAEKLSSLVEDIDFDDAETFEMKVKVVKESYFKADLVDSVDEANNLLGEDNQQVDLTDSMARYTQAIKNFNT